MKPEPARQNGQPALDEEVFEQLLSAAYVMQEHNARLKQGAAPANGAPPEAAAAPPTTSPPSETKAPQAATNAACRQCGHGFRGPELFCGICGTPRGEQPAAPAPKPWTSLWDMHAGTNPKITWHPPDAKTEDDGLELFPLELEEIVAEFSAREGGDEAKTVAETETAPAPPEADTGVTAPDKLALGGASHWVSAARAHDWFESLKSQQSTKQKLIYIWRRHGGVLSIAFASVFLLFVLVDWGLQPAPSAGANGVRPLTGFEQMLVSLGLAEVTPVQRHGGNPQTQVWVDPHTGLYYCPGAPLYQNTKDGRLSSQIDAQRDQFEPATRKACD